MKLQVGISAMMHVLLLDPFTNEFDDVSPGRLLRQVAQLYAGSLALPAFSLSGPVVPSGLITALLRVTD